MSSPSEPPEQESRAGGKVGPRLEWLVDGVSEVKLEGRGGGDGREGGGVRVRGVAVGWCVCVCGEGVNSAFLDCI